MAQIDSVSGKLSLIGSSDKSILNKLSGEKRYLWGFDHIQHKQPVEALACSAIQRSGIL